MITTFNLGEHGSEQDLAAGLRALGFTVGIEAEPASESWVSVTHEADEVGRLDGHVYAEVPCADIVRTSGPGGMRRPSATTTTPPDDQQRHPPATA